MSLHHSRILAGLTLPVICLLAGCGITINKPRNAALDPVVFNITWDTSEMSNIHIAIDGTDQTSQFIVNYAQQVATATIGYPPDGKVHTLQVTGSCSSFFCLTDKNGNATDSSTFQVVIQ